MHQHRYRFPDPKRLALNIRPSPKNSTAQHGVRADNSQKTTAQQLLANSYADSKRGRMQHQGPEPLQEWFCGYRRGRTRGGKAFAGLLASRQSVGADISRECSFGLVWSSTGSHIPHFQFIFCIIHRGSILDARFGELLTEGIGLIALAFALRHKSRPDQ